MSSYYPPPEPRSAPGFPVPWASGDQAYAASSFRVVSPPVVRKGAAPTVLAIISLVLLLGIVGVGGFILFRPNSDDGKKGDPADPVKFAVPSGLISTELKSDYAGDSPSYTRAYRLENGLAPYEDLIIVDAFKPDTAAATQSDSQLEQRVRALVANFQGTVASVTPTTVDGNRASQAQVTYPSPTGSQLSQRTYFIYAPKNLVQIRCQWVRYPAEIDKACRDLVAGIKIG